MDIQPMEFVDGLVQVETITTREQAQAVVDFLRQEVQRHVNAKCDAERSVDYHRAKALMYQSAIVRHVPDIESTEKKIQAIAGLWGLPGCE